MATVIISTIIIALAISSSLWTGGLVSVFTRYEKVEVKNAYVTNSGGNYVVNVEYVNTGSSPTSIDSVYLNGVPYVSYNPQPSLDFGKLPSVCETGASKSGKIKIPHGATDPSGNRLTDGVTLIVTLHTTGGKDYPTSVTLMGAGTIESTVQTSADNRSNTSQSNTAIDEWTTDTSGQTSSIGVIGDPWSTDPNYALKISYSGTGYGATSPVAGSYSYAQGTSIMVTATPSFGSTFGGWTLNGVAYTQNPISITMTSNSSLVATFTIVQTTTGIRSVGTYASYGSGASKVISFPSGDIDAWTTYGPTDIPRNRFNFCMLSLEYNVVHASAAWNPYLRQMRSYNRIPLFLLYWGPDNSIPIDTAKVEIQAMLGDVDLNLIGGVVFGDDVHMQYPGVADYYNAIYDWFKAKYPGVFVYQDWAVSEEQGPANGKPGFQPSWKADGWVWYSYWADYDQTKAFIQSCKTAQPGKPIIMILYFTNEPHGTDPYNFTPEQVQVAREDGCSVCLYAAGNPDHLYGWWTGDPVGQQRYAAGEALIDEIRP